MLSLLGGLLVSPCTLNLYFGRATSLSLAVAFRTHLSFELRLGCTFLYSAPKKLALESFALSIWIELPTIVASRLFAYLLNRPPLSGVIAVLYWEDTLCHLFLGGVVST